MIRAASLVAVVLALLSISDAFRFSALLPGEDRPGPPGNGSHHGPDGPHHGPHGHHGPHPHGPIEPRFEILNKTRQYELRQYSSTSWAATNVKAWQWEFALPKAVRKLVSYAHGDNDKGKEFPPSAPVLSRYVPRGNYSNCNKEFTIATYLPRRPCSKTNTTLPEPLDKSIKIKTFPAAQVYVRTFPGVAFHWNFLHEAFSFARSLRHDSVTVRGGMFFAAVYDPPFKLFGRRNEVWFLPPRNSSSSDDDFLWAGEGLVEAQLDGTTVHNLLVESTATA